MRLAIRRNLARGPYQSITLQQFIEIIEPARQGIVIFFTISSPCHILTPVPCQPPFGVSVNEVGLDSAAHMATGKDQNGPRSATSIFSRSKRV
jgi:hypothetical protein